jgi:hypothetical protein
MRTGYTHIVFVLDSSYSMNRIKNETVDGFNTFLNAQRNAEGYATLTQIHFSSAVHKRTKIVPNPFSHLNPNPPIFGFGSVILDSTKYGIVHGGCVQEQGQVTLPAAMIEVPDPYAVVTDFKDVKEVEDLVIGKTYQPGGGTPLYDTIGRAIKETGEKLTAMKEEDRPEKVLFIISTDGEENESQEYTKPMINEMIKHQTDVYSWDFMFFGANMDAMAEAQALGINSQSAVTYCADHAGTTSTFNTIAEKTATYRSLTGAMKRSALAYTDEERVAAMGGVNNKNGL